MYGHRQPAHPGIIFEPSKQTLRPTHRLPVSCSTDSPSSVAERRRQCCCLERRRRIMRRDPLCAPRRFSTSRQYDVMVTSFDTCNATLPLRRSVFCFCFVLFYYALLCFCHCILRIDVLIYSAPRLQECLINLLTYILTYLFTYFCYQLSQSHPFLFS